MNERLKTLEKLYDNERIKSQFLFGVLKKTLTKKPHSCNCNNEPNELLRKLQKDFMAIDFRDDIDNFVLYTEYWSKFEGKYHTYSQ